MANIIESDQIKDVIIVEPTVFSDTRGRFVETYRRSWFPLGREMLQGNRSEKENGAIVGFHYHMHQADYWYLLRGRALVVLHDLRVSSPTEGATMHFELDGETEKGVFIPPGVAHGFATLTDITLTYLVDGYYNPDDELGIAYDDPEIGADWQIADAPIVSKRDQENPKRREISDRFLPRYGLRR
ncbi:MAG: dTDP-4-dehydrorhamnose 3,5-epimerase [Firmicutes bacterium]|jgi:dTDP-4-dehydrorhamnose 3,5-epimerase|nr:dTDP-4-dehydrorhamnose 3,5-epimerase [Bacillota bacterium]